MLLSSFKEFMEPFAMERGQGGDTAAFPLVQSSQPYGNSRIRNELNFTGAPSDSKHT